MSFDWARNYDIFVDHEMTDEPSGDYSVNVDLSSVVRELLVDNVFGSSLEFHVFLNDNEHMAINLHRTRGQGGERVDVTVYFDHNCGTSRDDTDDLMVFYNYRVGSDDNGKEMK